MRKPTKATTLVFAICGAAAAHAARADAPMPFSFVPHIYQSTAAEPQCRTPLGAGWFNYLSNRHTVTSTFPTFLGKGGDRNWFTGPICYQFASQDPRWPTGEVLIWIWGRATNDHIVANAYHVRCLDNKLQRKFSGRGFTVDEVRASTVSVVDAELTIGNAPPGTYAVPVCRLLEMFYPGRGAWYDYPQ